MALVLVSCNKKAKQTTTDDSPIMGNDSTMVDNDATIIKDKTKTKEHQEQLYACSMHPEVQGN